MNKVADALSRQPHLNAMTTITAILMNDDTLKQSYHTDNYFGPILDTLRNPDQANEKQKAHAKYFEIQQECLYLKGTQ